MKIKESNKVTLWEKLSHFILMAGNIPEQTIISTYLLIFYTNVWGMNPAAVATLFLITKILDAVNDPVIGYIMDHLPKFKMGRFKPYILIFVPVMAINFMLVFIGPALVPAGLKLLVAYITYIAIGITFTLANVPMNAIYPAATDDPKDRNTLGIFRGMASLLGGSVVVMVAPGIITKYNGEQKGYFVLVIGATAIILITTFIACTGLKERVNPPESEKSTLRDALNILKSKGVLITVGAGLVCGTVVNLLASANTYYAMYVLGDLNYMSLYSLIMTVGMLPASVILPALCTRFGEKKMMCITLAASMLAGLIRIVMPMNIPLYYVSGLLSGITMGGVGTVTMIICANLVDFVEYEQNVRVDATVSSLNSFSAKVSSAIGTAIPGYILAWTGFSETEAVQSASALMGIKCNFNWVPLILSAVGFLMYLFLYPMGKSKMEEIRKALQTRRTSETVVTER